MKVNQYKNKRKIKFEKKVICVRENRVYYNYIKLILFLVVIITYIKTKKKTLPSASRQVFSVDVEFISFLFSWLKPLYRELLKRRKTC